MIDIQVNNTTHSFPESITILVVLQQLEVALEGIAVAVNQSIVSKNEWENHTLKNKDNILIIQATQGG